MVVPIVVLDQISKFAAVKYLKGNNPYVIIENFFQLDYVENFGAAFGILQNKRIIFIIITSIVILGIIFFLAKHPDYLNRWMKIALVMLLGGTIGNFIDRVRQGYVIDFISFRFGRGYDFPVFNVADIFIVTSTILIMILVLFNEYEV